VQSPAAGWKYLVIRAIVLFLDLFRWSQITAALSVWGMVTLAIAAMWFVSAEQQGADPLGTILVTLYRMPLVGDWMTESAAQNDGALKLSGNELEALAIRAWMIVTFAGVAISWLWSALRRRERVRPGLRRILLLIAGAALFYFAVMTGLMFADRDLFNGPDDQWLLTFAAFSVILFVVGGWAALVSRATAMVGDALIKLAPD